MKYLSKSSSVVYDVTVEKQSVFISFNSSTVGHDWPPVDGVCKIAINGTWALYS